MAADVTHDKGIKRRRMETFKVEALKFKLLHLTF